MTPYTPECGPGLLRTRGMKIFRITKFEIYSIPEENHCVWVGLDEKYIVTKMRGRTFFSKLNEKLCDNSL